jgi:hypothetical protein
MEIPDNLLPFLGEHIGKDYFKRGNFVDDETFLTICHNYTEWFLKHKDTIVQNIHELHALMGNETGYDALTVNWKRVREWKGIGDVERWDKAAIEKHVMDVMSRSMNHLYQKRSWKKKEEDDEVSIRNGGLLVVSYINVRISLSEKRNLKDVIVDYGLELSIHSGEHEEFNCDE